MKLQYNRKEKGVEKSVKQNDFRMLPELNNLFIGTGKGKDQRVAQAEGVEVLAAWKPQALQLS